MYLLGHILFCAGVAAASPTPAQLGKRQLEPLVNLAGAVLPSIKAINIQPMDASKNLRMGTKKVQAKYGPLELRASNVHSWLPFNGGSMDPAGTAFFRTLDDDFPRNITVLSTDMKFVMEDGSPADLSKGIYEHHAQLIDTSKKAYNAFTCQNGQNDWTTPAMSIFMGGGTNSKDGSWFTTPDGKLNSGFYIGPDDNIFMQLDLVNYNKYPVKVYMLAEMEYVEGQAPEMLDVSIQLSNVGKCTGEGLYVEIPKDKKKFTLSGKEMVATRDGQMIAGMGHLHDGATDLTVKINGQDVCKSDASYGKSVGGGMMMHGGHKRAIASYLSSLYPRSTSKLLGERSKAAEEPETIQKMSFCRNVVSVKKGDVVLLEAHYDYEAHPARMNSMGGMAENMGVFTAFFAVPL